MLSDFASKGGRDFACAAKIMETARGLVLSLLDDEIAYEQLLEGV